MRAQIPIEFVLIINVNANRITSTAQLRKSVCISGVDLIIFAKIMIHIEFVALVTVFAILDFQSVHSL